MVDLTAIGECLIEFNELEGGFYSRALAGDVVNTLFYANRLGLQSEFISCFGNDPFTKSIVQFFKKEGVSIEHVPILNQNNGVYFVQVQSGQSVFHFLRKDSAATETLNALSIDEIGSVISSSHQFLFTGVGLAVLKNKEKLVALLPNLKDTRLYFDINFRPSLWSDPAELIDMVKEIAHTVHTIFVSEGDDAKLFGTRSVKKAMEHYRSLGYERGVYRVGEQGAYAWLGNTAYYATALNVAVVDTTGAGDAFNAGFLSSDKWNGDIRNGLQWGTASAAVAIQERGGIALGYNPLLVEGYGKEVMVEEVAAL